MFGSITKSLIAAFGIAACLLSAPAIADTWTDQTGKFELEAEFVGVKGRAVILRKPNGDTVEVPISKLSPESRKKAKTLYEAQRSGNDSRPASPTAVATTSAFGSYTPAAIELNFAPPSPPAVEPMEAFPSSPSLQQTVDFVRRQLMAGHPEVILDALPADMLEMLDSKEFRDAMKPSMEQQAVVVKQIQGVLMKAVEVLVTKKEYVLGSQMLMMVPAEAKPLIEQGYDPAVGIVYELILLSINSEAMAEVPFSQIIRYYAPRIGGHLRELASIYPPGMIDGFLDRITVEESSSTGTVTFLSQTGPTDVAFTKYQDRWLPTDLVEQWEANKEDMLTTLMQQQTGGVDLSDPQVQQQVQMGVGMIVTMGNGILDPMLQATSQQEFDQATMQIMQLIGTFSQGGGGGL